MWWEFEVTLCSWSGEFYLKQNFELFLTKALIISSKAAIESKTRIWVNFSEVSITALLYSNILKELIFTTTKISMLSIVLEHV